MAEGQLLRNVIAGYETARQRSRDTEDQKIRDLQRKRLEYELEPGLSAADLQAYIDPATTPERRAEIAAGLLERKGSFAGPILSDLDEKRELNETIMSGADAEQFLMGIAGGQVREGLLPKRVNQSTLGQLAQLVKGRGGLEGGIGLSDQEIAMLADPTTSAATIAGLNAKVYQALGVEQGADIVEQYGKQRLESLQMFDPGESAAVFGAMGLQSRGQLPPMTQTALTGLAGTAQRAQGVQTRADTAVTLANLKAASAERLKTLPTPVQAAMVNKLERQTALIDEQIALKQRVDPADNLPFFLLWLTGSTDDQFASDDDLRMATTLSQRAALIQERDGVSFAEAADQLMNEAGSPLLEALDDEHAQRMQLFSRQQKQEQPRPTGDADVDVPAALEFKFGPMIEQAITSDQDVEITDEQIIQAIEEAGYEVQPGADIGPARDMVKQLVLRASGATDAGEAKKPATAKSSASAAPQPASAPAPESRAPLPAFEQSISPESREDLQADIEDLEEEMVDLDKQLVDEDDKRERRRLEREKRRLERRIKRTRERIDRFEKKATEGGGSVRTPMINVPKS